MNRRDALLGLAAIAAPSFAQTPRVKLVRIGVLSAETLSGDAIRLEAVRAGLRDLGYVEGKSLVIESRWAAGKYDQLPRLAGELVRSNVDVIVTFGTKATVGAKQATATVPIVMASSGDIIAMGIVGSLARPGGNVTGSTNVGVELGSKRLELLRELMPRASRVAYLSNRRNPAFSPNLKAIEKTARVLKLEVQPFEVEDPTELASIFSQIAKQRIDALILQDETSFTVNAKVIAALAVTNRWMSVGNKNYAESGGLLGYGPDIRALDRRAAYFVDKILTGTKPSDLPIEQPTKYELVINLKTAKAIGGAIPQELLLRADNVIR